MTNEQLKLQLMADPSAAISFILNNNPDAVTDNLRGLGFNVATWEDMGQALNELLERGEKGKFVSALTVPFLTENADPGEVLAVKDAAIALNARSGKNVAKSGVSLLNILGGLATGTLYTLEQSGEMSVQTKPEAGGGKPPAPPEKDKTWTYIGIGLAVLAVIVVIVIIAKKK
jgi:hypothetical protein